MTHNLWLKNCPWQSLFTYVRFMSKSCLGFIVINVFPSTSETVVSISYLSDPWRLNPFPFGEEFDATLISEFKPFTSVGYLHSSLRPGIVDDPDPVAKLENNWWIYYWFIHKYDNRLGVIENLISFQTKTLCPMHYSTQHCPIPGYNSTPILKIKYGFHKILSQFREERFWVVFL